MIEVTSFFKFVKKAIKWLIIKYSENLEKFMLI